jgi:hypothetical protein
MLAPVSTVSPGLSFARIAAVSQALRRHMPAASKLSRISMHDTSPPRFGALERTTGCRLDGANLCRVRSTGIGWARERLQSGTGQPRREVHTFGEA